MLTSVLSGAFVGLLAANTKLLTDTIKSSPSIEAAMLNPLFYLFSLNVTICLLSNFYNLNVTMSLYSQLYVLPFYESCVICFNLISGLILMGEYEVYTRQ